MVNLLRSLRTPPAAAVARFDGLEAFGFAGQWYYGMPGPISANEERVDAGFASMVADAYRRNGVVFACELTRVLLFTEARFAYQRFRKGRPGDLWSDPSLELLHVPWRGGTTGDLLARMLLHADFGGSAFVTPRPAGLRAMRPDWVTIIMGSPGDPDVTGDDLDAELLGYVYHPGGAGSGRQPVPLLADEVAHFAPIPDPLANYRGMSWLSPLVREVEADSAATGHKLAFFRNGATPQVIVSFDKQYTLGEVQAFAQRMDATHSGWQNAYRTLYLGGGADVTVAGKDLAQLEFKATQGAGETRIAAAAGVHPVIAGLSEGLAGSSLNAGNFNSARRLVADRTLRPLWRNVAGSMAPLLPVPADSRLWYDDRDIAFLREDAKDAAEITQIQAQTIGGLVKDGFTRESATAATINQNMDLLVPDPDWVSVQLQAGAGGPPAVGSLAPAGAVLNGGGPGGGQRPAVG